MYYLLLIAYYLTRAYCLEPTECLIFYFLRITYYLIPLT